jgi:hypothetical protein
VNKISGGVGMKKDILLENIKRSRVITEQIDEINEKLDYYHSMPMSGHAAVISSTVINLSLLSALFVVGALNWKILLLAPMFFYFVRGIRYTYVVERKKRKNHGVN